MGLRAEELLKDISEKNVNAKIPPLGLTHKFQERKQFRTKIKQNRSLHAFTPLATAGPRQSSYNLNKQSLNPLKRTNS